MDLLDYIFGGATVLSLLITLWQFQFSRSKATVEEAKTQMQLERLRNAKFSIVGATETVNLLIQTSKGNSSPEELANLGRVARAQLLIIIQALESEEKKLMYWKYGKLFESQKNYSTVKPLGSEEN